jgi:hypothetical protein
VQTFLASRYPKSSKVCMNPFDGGSTPFVLLHTRVSRIIVPGTLACQVRRNKGLVKWIILLAYIYGQFSVKDLMLHLRRNLLVP